ncbi:hypothetical protein O181_099024 [Austropuccinia psidii MF-1]|uniref:Uncharacterized protein n=1 Tax=Austropuccinia psidii MF-1 TaxID=1389203 RepID=A0A9Q3PF33_9BASI|nr:hypothetical protein [Austropuccinia psidii MF-1]
MVWPIGPNLVLGWNFRNTNGGESFFVVVTLEEEESRSSSSLEVSSNLMDPGNLHSLSRENVGDLSLIWGVEEPSGELKVDDKVED